MQVVFRMARVAWFALAAGIACAQSTAPVKLLDVSRTVADATKGKEAMAQLAQLPLAECQTVEFHVMLAKAARNANVAAQVAEAVGIVNLLPAQVAPSSIGLVGQELPQLRSWLQRRGDELYAKALSAHDVKDMKTAVKAYLVAVKCYPAVMSREDRGMGARGLSALRTLAAAHPEKVDLLFQLGYYSHLFGDSKGAISALEAHQRLQNDPYKKWRGAIWLASIRAEDAGTPPSRPGGAITGGGRI